MKIITVAFDIDGTLISNSQGLGQEHLRIDVYNLLVLLSKMRNTKCIVWSGGGQDYAEQVVRKYGLTPYVTRCYDKHLYDETIDGEVSIAFDDESDFSLALTNIIVHD